MVTDIKIFICYRYVPRMPRLAGGNAAARNEISIISISDAPRCARGIPEGGIVKLLAYKAGLPGA